MSLNALEMTVWILSIIVSVIALFISCTVMYR
nr:MAG TPA: hypothetical protein [Caudoviricetes sp.]